jgi:hypothetical protein
MIVATATRTGVERLKIFVEPDSANRHQCTALWAIDASVRVLRRIH